MDIIISNTSEKAIYEQIYDQIKLMILEGKLAEGDALPSMRLLAKELRISVITTKRAYEELEREGFIVSITGKGSFVGKSNIDFIREEHLKNAEQLLARAAAEARLGGMSRNEFKELSDILFSE